MNHYSKLRKIAAIFHLYGISLSGKRKYDNLYKDLNMDQAFVLGLIFDLELALQTQLDDDTAYGAQIPALLIQKLVA
ncbi:acyl carrier protein [Lunatibacter salilacus]|uniref:acyl carrier protein n=1 Tax=Lunatibacter salilacus TaxID=2483804 RepID=UPI00131AF351|nr:acyl carrier protein [Lunatibacter salilacus]